MSNGSGSDIALHHLSALDECIKQLKASGCRVNGFIWAAVGHGQQPIVSIDALTPQLASHLDQESMNTDRSDWSTWHAVVRGCRVVWPRDHVATGVH